MSAVGRRKRQLAAVIKKSGTGRRPGNKIQEGMQKRNTSEQLSQVCYTVYDQHQE